MNLVSERRREIIGIGDKCAARILLSDRSRRILVPSAYEWRGIGLLERDGGLVRRKVLSP